MTGLRADRRTLLRGHRRNPCKKTQGQERLAMTRVRLCNERSDAAIYRKKPGSDLEPGQRIEISYLKISGRKSR